MRDSASTCATLKPGRAACQTVARTWNEPRLPGVRWQTTGSSSPGRGVLLYICTLLFSFNLAASTTDFLVHLDKNYCFSGEVLQGAIHHRASGQSSLKLALLSRDGELVCDARIRLDRPIEPFRLKIPAETQSGIYRLTAIDENSCQVIYQSTYRVINPLTLNQRELEVSTNGDKLFQRFSNGIVLEWLPKSPKSSTTRDLVIKSSSKLPLQLSVKVSDQAQSLADGNYAVQVDPQMDRSVFSTPTNGFELSGYLKIPEGEPCGYCPVVLTVPEQVNGIYYTMTDESGRFIVTGLTHTGNKKAYLWSDRNTQGKYRFEVEPDQCIPVAINAEPGVGTFPTDLEPRLLRKLLSYQIAEEQCPPKATQVRESIPNYQQVDLFPEPDNRVLFDEFYLGSDMKETIKSIVPNVNFVRKTGLRIFSFENRQNFPDTPLILLDGIPVSDTLVLGLNPQSVHRIDVLQKSSSLQKVGNLARNGVLSLVTKSGTDNYSISGVEKMYVRGYDNLANTSSIAASCPLQQVLYWNPALVVDQPTMVIRVPLPDYYVQPVVSVVGFDAQGTLIQGQLGWPNK